ncbi:MAG: hypothetical protein VW274_10060 [Thalassolituus sp.]
MSDANVVDFQKAGEKHRAERSHREKEDKGFSAQKEREEETVINFIKSKFLSDTKKPAIAGFLSSVVSAS